MLKGLRARFHQGHRTMRYPNGPPPALSDRFRGVPVLDALQCADGCRACADACPTDAIVVGDTPAIDLGRCLFCTECVSACPEGALNFSRDHRLATRTRDALVVGAGQELELARALAEKTQRVLGRALKLRQVSAGGCNACEADANVLTTLAWDIGRFGIQFVASPRHADGLLITGAVSENMRLALETAYAAVPDPKIVIAVGACAISGGPFAGHPEQHGGADAIVPVDLYVPGCPPHPLTLLDGLLRLIDRMPARTSGLHEP